MSKYGDGDKFQRSLDEWNPDDVAFTAEYGRAQDIACSFQRLRQPLLIPFHYNYNYTSMDFHASRHTRSLQADNQLCKSYPWLDGDWPDGLVHRAGEAAFLH